MSLVGTRPPTVDEWEKYELHHRSRMSTKPGITGMWQVSGRSDITDFEEVVRLDTEYIEHWTMAFSVIIRFLPMRFTVTCRWIVRTCFSLRKLRFTPALRTVAPRLRLTCWFWHTTVPTVCL